MAAKRVWSSRKFVSAWVLTATFILLLCSGKLTPEAFSTCASFIWIGYFAGNVGDRFAEKRNEP